MDTNIRNLLTFAKSNTGEPGVQALQKAYEYMRNVAETKPTRDGPEPFGQDLLVLGAEIAFQMHGQSDLTKEFLKIFFMKTQPSNQFLCRAYLCQSRLLAPTSAENTDQLEKAVVYLIKAINMAKEQPRYHFLVYNASVIYWQFSRPFLKTGYRQYLARSLHQVVKALDDIDDKDYEWRAQLMIALMECHVDAGHRSDASHIATAASSFIRQHVPSLYKTVFGLMVRHQLVEPTKLQKDIKTSAELNIFYRISRLKLALDQQETEKDFEDEMRKILNVLSGQEDKTAPGGTTATASQSKDRGGKAGSRSNSPDERRSPSRQPRGRTPTPTGARRLPADSTDKKNVDPRLSKPYLLLELARLALQQNLADIAQQCADLLIDCASQVKNSTFLLEVEFMNCDLLVKQLGDRQESYSKSIIEIRTQAIKRCDEALTNAVRLGDPNSIQAGCVTLWNLCLPLQQPNLRHYVRRPLSNVAVALENIQSLLVQLRCQVHMELAKCEEDQEQISVAISHLNKALGLDDGQVYRERLEVALHKLELRAELYKQPERPEDQAAMIIEQARKADSGTMRMKRSLLVRAGQALAPDTFLLVLDSENEAKEMIAIKGHMTMIKKLAGKAVQFNTCVKKAEGHLRRLGDENDRERARLWGDLAKTARKQEVWDVCRVAARFCLLYDDNRWKNEPEIKDSVITKMPTKSKSNLDVEAVEPEKSATDLSKDKNSVSRLSKDQDDGQQQQQQQAEKAVPLYDKDLIRMMAEVNFVNGEALVHLLRTEKVELGDNPIPPEDKSKKPKGFVAKKPEEDPDWIEYCNWIKYLTGEAVSHFLRAVALGVELNEPWIVCSAGTYVWNYNNHVLSQMRHKEVVDPLQTVVDGMKKIGHAGETVLLLDICTALVTGLILPWLPKPQSKEVKVSDPDPKSPGLDKSAKKAVRGGGPAAGGVVKAGRSQMAVSGDALPDLKRAVEVCEYAMKVTNGDDPLDVVPIATRYRLLLVWVQTKQMLQSNITRSLGTEDETSDAGQNGMTRAIVAVEMLSLMKNGIYEFKDGPNLAQCVELVESCEWSDHLIELQLWTRLSLLAFSVHNHTVVSHCSTRALEFAKKGTRKHGKKQDSHSYTVEQEQLSFASSICGQSLIQNSQGSSSLRRQAMQHFLNSAKYAKNAKNYELVMSAARHYWNASLPLIHLPIERELLRDPLNTLLQAINDTTDKSKYKRDEEDEEKEGEDMEGQVKAAREALEPTPADGVQNDQSTTEAKQELVEASKLQGMIGGPDDDLTVRAYLYGVLFQSYADKGEWEAGLQAMDQAVHNMPRTNHRLLIYKHLVVVKAKLGLSVGMSVQKFKDESEDYVAHMWRRIALCSKQPTEQLIAYQNAIEALNSESGEWQKMDYLLEFGQWLYCNDFPLEDCLNQIDWAIDILLNMKFEVEQTKKDVKGKKSKKKGKTPPASATKKSSSKKPSTHDKKAPATPGDSGKKSPVASEVEASIAGESTGEGGPKTAVIGVAPVNPALSLKDLHNMRQLEALFRAHTLRAQLEGPASPGYNDTCLMAYAYIMQMWRVSMAASGPVMKEIAKNPPHEEPPTGKASAKAKKSGKEPKEVVKEKPKRKGALDSVPSSTEDWASYDAPEEAIEAFKHSAMKTTGINKHTITKPTLTMLYLELLTQQVRDIGYNHLALPVLALSDVVSRGMLDHRATTALVHLRALEVCVELNLSQGASFHEHLADFKLNEDEQARSREDMALWAEKRAQVYREEMRLKESLVKFSENKTTAKSTSHKSEEEDEKTAIHLGRIIGAVEFRNVWTDTAECLLNQTAYQPARELLHEAHMAAVEFDDKALEARTLYLLARLSYMEAQYGQAITLCLEAQKTYNGDEMCWFDTTMLMVKATQEDYQLKEVDRYRKARALVIHALNVFRQVAQQRPNKASITTYILASLEATLGSIQAHITLTEHDNILKPAVIQALLSASKKLEGSAGQLETHGYHRDAVRLLQEQAQLIIKIARQSERCEEQHAYYTNALVQLRRTCKLSAELLVDVHTMVTIHEMKAMSLPVQREAVEAKLLLGQLLCEMLQVHVKETHQKQLDDQKKGAVLRAVEELIYVAPEYSGSEKLWHDSISTAADCVQTELVATHLLSVHTPKQRAKALSILGHCQHLLALLKCPDQPKHWNLDDMEVLSVAQHIQDTEAANQEGEDEEDEDITSTKNYDRFSNQITSIKISQELCVRYMAHSSELLTQAVNLAISKGHLDVVGEASLQLVECLGQYDPGLASNYLALHQSCQASLYMEDLLKNALSDPSLSQQAALLHQRQQLLTGNTTTNSQEGPAMKSIIHMLQEQALAWKRLAVSPQHLDLLRELPHNFNLVILQHSPDKSYLYGAVLDKPRQAGGGGKAAGKGATTGAVTQAASRARVVRIKTDVKQLEELETRWKWWRHDVMQVLLKQEYQRAQQAQREKMLSNLGDNLKQGSKAVYEEEVAGDERRLHEEFLGHLEALEQYLAPITSQLDVTLRPPSSTTISNIEPGFKHKAPKDEGPPQDYVVLLADPHLMQLPLEALQCFQAESIVSLTRDISLQMLHHRTHVEQLDEAAEKAKREREKNKPPPRIPGLRDANKKQSKIIPLDRPVTSGYMSLDTHSFRYIVDPCLDCAETEESQPISVMNEVMELHSQQFTPRWLGVEGDDHSPSPGEYEIYMIEGGAFIFYGMERFLCYLPPHKLAALNLPDCQFVMLLDLTQTNKSSLRQSKTDVLKTHDVLALEKPVEASLLLSLAGVNCVMANQWHCSLKENAARFKQTMQDFLERGKTSGQTTRLLISPDHRQREIQAQADAEAAVDTKAQTDATVSRDNLDDVAQTDPANGELAADVNKMHRGWFNMVCYGLPNLLVTQLSKP